MVAKKLRPQYAKPGAKVGSLKKLSGKVIKSGKHTGKKRVVLSKKGQKLRAKKLAPKRKHPKRKGSKGRKSHKKKK